MWIEIIYKNLKHVYQRRGKTLEDLERDLLREQQDQQTENLENEISDGDVVENNLDFNADSEISADDCDDTENSMPWSQDGPNYVGKNGNILWKVHHIPKLIILDFIISSLDYQE